MRRLFVILATLSVLPLAAQNEDDARQFQKLAQVFRYLSGLYVDEVEMKPVVEGAITGMLEELDPHSAYIGAEEMKGVQESFDGEFSGIGVEFNVLRDTVIVVNTIAGGPAERVGVRANDRIVRIDTLDAVGMSRTDVPKHLRGKTGTKVGIDVVRHGTPGIAGSILFMAAIHRFVTGRTRRAFWFGVILMWCAGPLNEWLAVFSQRATDLMSAEIVTGCTVLATLYLLVSKRSRNTYGL